MTNLVLHIYLPAKADERQVMEPGHTSSCLVAIAL